MGERKVLNKYYPPDFDPATIPRRKKPKNEHIKVRMMLPMSIRCNMCRQYIYKGTKFNCRKEDVNGETYLGIQIFRFYFKCTNCAAEITMKTDPQNSDYVVEKGAGRNFEPRDEVKPKRVGEDPMNSMEKRMMDSKREIDIEGAVNELISMKTRQATVSVDSMLGAMQRSCPRLPEENKDHIESIFQARNQIDKRINDKDLKGDDDLYPKIYLKKRKTLSSNPIDFVIKKKETRGTSLGGRFIFKSSSAQVSVKASHLKKLPEPELKLDALLSLRQQYDGDEDDD